MTNKYLRTIYGVDKEGNAGSLQVDVYDILDAYPTRNPALDHLVKKALCPGQRGHKDLLTDLDDILKSAQRAKQMTLNKMSCTTEVTLSVPDGSELADLLNAKAPYNARMLEAMQKAEDGAAPLVIPRLARATPLISAAAARPTCFDGMVLCYYPDKLQAEGILKTFQELAQKAGIVTKAVGRADEVGADGILVDGKDPSENVIRRFMDQELFIYGVREANVILRGHLARDKEEDVPQSIPARGYKTAFDTRPTSFIGASVYIIEGIDEEALARLEHEIAQVDVLPYWVRSNTDCPDGSIVIRPSKARPVEEKDTRWYFSVHRAIAILVGDQKGNDHDA